MIQSLFILSPVGEVLIERHFRGVVTSRSVVDAFWEHASRSVNHHGGVSATTSLLNQQHYDTVPPVLELPESDQGTLYVISVLRDGLSYLAVCPAEVSPLLILEFLHRIANIFVEYFGQPLADESAIKDNFSTVYQLLEEMIDYGWPLTTEPNALKALVRPPTVMSKLLQQSSAGNELPSGTVSNMPWRAAGVHYSNNEIYMDIVEEVNAIVDARGTLVSTDVSGSIQCQCHLSGVPDLLLTFKDPHLIDDCSFHPCVRYARFDHDQVVSFVPPDGNFELMKYRIAREQIRSFAPPIYCHAQWHMPTQHASSSASASTTSGPAGMGRVLLQLGATSLNSLVLSASRGKGQPLLIEEVAVTIPFPNSTRTTSDYRVSVGTIMYDEASKVARWTIGKVEMTTKASLSCSFMIATSEKQQETPPNLSLAWKIPLASVSGVSVSGLSVTGESYKPYKGVRNITKSGLFQVRCG